MNLSDDDDDPGLGSTCGPSFKSSNVKERGSQNRSDNEDDRRGTNLTSMSPSDDDDDDDDDDEDVAKNVKFGNGKSKNLFRRAVKKVNMVNRLMGSKMSKSYCDSARALAPDEERKNVLTRDENGKLVVASIIVKKICHDSMEFDDNVKDGSGDETSGFKPGILAIDDSYQSFPKHLFHHRASFESESDYLLSEEEDDEDEQTGAEAECDDKKEEQGNNSDSDERTFDLDKQYFNQRLFMAVTKTARSDLTELGDQHENANNLLDKYHNIIEESDDSDEGDVAVGAPGGWKNAQEEEQQKHTPQKRRESYSGGSDDFDDIFEIQMVESAKEIDSTEKRLNQRSQTILGMEAKAKGFLCKNGRSLRESRRSCYSKTFDVLAKAAAQALKEDDQDTAEYCWNSIVGSASYRKNERTKRLAQQLHHFHQYSSWTSSKTTAIIPETPEATRTTAASSFVGDDVSFHTDSIFHEAILRYPHHFANHNKGNPYHTCVPAVAAAGQGITTTTTNQRATARTTVTCPPVINDADSNAENVFDEALSLAKWIEVHGDSLSKVADDVEQKRPSFNRNGINNNSSSSPDYNSKGYELTKDPSFATTSDDSREGKIEEFTEESSPTSLDEAKINNKAMKERNIMIVDTLDHLLAEHETEIQHLQSRRKKQEDGKYSGGRDHRLLLEHFEMDRKIRKLNEKYIVIKENHVQALAYEDELQTRIDAMASLQGSKITYLTKLINKTVADIGQIERDMVRIKQRGAIFGGPLVGQLNTVLIDFGKFVLD